MTKLFISYRSLDSAKVDTLVSRLRSLKNPNGTFHYDIWQDKNSIPVGQDWWKAIVQGIIDSEIFIFMISQESVQNPNCRAELSYARKRNRPIIPLVLDNEFVYNPVTGKNDIGYWDNVPDEIKDGRFQFLFYEGVSFIDQLNQAVDLLKRSGLRDIPAVEPPDPRNANDTTNDSGLIYDQACDYAGRLDFTTAEKLFQRLLDWRDPLFADDAHEWIVLLRSYEQMVRLDERTSTRHKIPNLWKTYAQQFPKPFTPLFDPKNFNSLYGDNITSAPSAESVKKKPSHMPPVIAKIAPKRPSSLDLMPAPFAWIDIPGKIGRTWKGESYKIAKYPITNAQFAKFIEAGGYRQRQWWTDAGWQQREEEKWTQPRYWTDAQSNGAEYLVVGVSWYESVAFCLWLSDVTGEQIMLPTEDQWQYAAQGDDGREYPWGNQPDTTRCNTSESKIHKTTPVRHYEGKGDSPFGVVDMAGNVWEWCLTDYDNETNDVNSVANTRVVRGGSFYSAQDSARAASRNYRLLPSRLIVTPLSGFGLCVVPHLRAAGRWGGASAPNLVFF